MHQLDIAVDFDGTVVTEEYPRIGKGIGATPVLRRLSELGHNIILLTMRENFKETVVLDEPYGTQEPGNYLSAAIGWFKVRGIPLFSVNCNPNAVHARKVWAHIYIDDRAAGAPLSRRMPNERRHIDWLKMTEILKDIGALDPNFFYDKLVED